MINKITINTLVITFLGLYFLVIPCENWYRYIEYYQIINKSQPIKYTYISTEETRGFVRKFGGGRRLKMTFCCVNILYKSGKYTVKVDYEYCRNMNSDAPRLYFLKNKNEVFSEWTPRTTKKLALFQSGMMFLFIIIPGIFFMKRDFFKQRNPNNPQRNCIL